MRRSLLLILCFISLDGCTFQFGTLGAVQGRNVQRLIDAKLATVLVSRDPKLVIGPSRCPSQIELSGGTNTSCSLMVDGVRIPIRATDAGVPGSVIVNFEGSFFERTWIESYVQRRLFVAYDISAVARCPGPKVQELSPGTYFACSILGSAKVHSVRLKALTNGNLFFYNVPGLVALDAPPAAALHLHKIGKPVMLSGAVLAAYINRTYLESDPNPATLIVSCPALANLSGARHVTCRASLSGSHLVQRIDVFIVEPNGFVVRTLDAVINRANLQAMIQRSDNQQLHVNGLP
ncbi:MAG: hypothetical protein ACYC8W_11800 [Candidatus Tyrphobacter sp.]